MRLIAVFMAGLLFGLGLTVAQMTSPQKVLDFLDITRNWDPSLALVMGAALVVAAIGFQLRKGMASPLFAELFKIPTSKVIDRKLVIGALLFGAGWGLVGYCPGPAIASLAFASQPLIIFVIAMLLGMVGARRWL